MRLRFRTIPRTRGQVLLEVLLALLLVSILAASVATLIVVTQRNLEAARRRDVAASLSAEVFSALRTIAESDDSATQGYNKLYCPPSGSCPGMAKGTGGTKFKTTIVNSQWALQEALAGPPQEERIIVANIDFARYLTVENVCRDPDSGNITGLTDSSGAATTCSGAGEGIDRTVDPNDEHDPGVQRVTATITAAQMGTFTTSQYVTRWRNVSSNQSDWSGGAE